MKRKESEEALDAMESVLAASAPKPRKKNFLERNFIPLKTDKKREKRRKVLFDIAVLIMFVCVLVLLWYFIIEPWIAQRSQEKVKGARPPIELVTTPEGVTVPAPPDPEQQRLSYDKLKAWNPDYIGWLSVPGAEIDLPIVRAENNSTYLKLDFDKKRSNYGNPFMDYRNKDLFADTNLVIYGHHMRSGSNRIFAKLTNFQEKETIYKFPSITLELKDVTLQYKVAAVFLTNGAPEEDNGYVFAYDTRNFQSRESFEGYVKQLKERTLFHTLNGGNIDILYGDHLITLQTCLYGFRNEYLVVVGRLLREGEDPNIPQDQVHHNQNVRYPQAWYTKYRNGVNPWLKGERWYP